MIATAEHIFNKYKDLQLQQLSIYDRQLQQSNKYYKKTAVMYTTMT